MPVLGTDYEVFVDSGDSRARGHRAGLRPATVEDKISPVRVGDERFQLRPVVGRYRPSERIVRDDPHPGERMCRSVEISAGAK